MLGLFLRIFWIKANSGGQNVEMFGNFAYKKNHECCKHVNLHKNINLPCLMKGEILLSPLFVMDGRAIIGFPSPSKASAAPLMKSTCPPNPEYILVPMESETTCPVKSTSIHELIAVILGCRAIIPSYTPKIMLFKRRQQHFL